MDCSNEFMLSNLLLSCNGFIKLLNENIPDKVRLYTPSNSSLKLTEINKIYLNLFELYKYIIANNILNKNKITEEEEIIQNVNFEIFDNHKIGGNKKLIKGGVPTFFQRLLGGENSKMLNMDGYTFQQFITAPFTFIALIIERINILTKGRKY